MTTNGLVLSSEGLKALGSAIDKIIENYGVGDDDRIGFLVSECVVEAIHTAAPYIVAYELERITRTRVTELIGTDE